MSPFSLALILILTGASLTHVKAQDVNLNRAQLASWIPQYATLTNIFLNSKSIASIDPQTFNDLTRMTYLSLWSNKLSILAAGTFDSLVNVLILLLDRNQMTQIDVQLFKNLINLTELDLHDNKLANIIPETFDTLVKLNSNQ